MTGVQTCALPISVSQNRTSLVIAHRLSTVIDADEILVLEQGRITERGRHNDLIAKNGAYAAMWNRQKEAAEARQHLEELETEADVASATLVSAQ